MQRRLYMGNLLNMDSPFLRFMSKLADLILLNFLCILCCIPIITIGASITATYYVTLKIVRGEEPSIVKSFFKSFKTNFLQATLIHIIMSVIAFLLYLDYYLVYNPNTALGTGTLILLVIISFVYIIVLTYIYPVLAQFYNSTIKIFQNSIFMSIRHFKCTLTIVFTIFVVGIALVLFSFKLFYFYAFIFLILGFSGTAYLNSHFFVRVFDTYIPETTETHFSEEAIMLDEAHVLTNEQKESTIIDENPNA